MKNTNKDFANEELNEIRDTNLQELKEYRDLLDSKAEIIGWLDIYSIFLANWSIIINESVQERIEKKQLLGLPYDDEQKMLTNLNYFFNKTAFFSEMLSNWHEDLELSKALADHYIMRG